MIEHFEELDGSRLETVRDLLRKLFENELSLGIDHDQERKGLSTVFACVHLEDSELPWDTAQTDW